MKGFTKVKYCFRGFIVFLSQDLFIGIQANKSWMVLGLFSRLCTPQTTHNNKESGKSLIYPEACFESRGRHQKINEEDRGGEREALIMIFFFKRREKSKRRGTKTKQRRGQSKRSGVSDREAEMTQAASK